MEIKQLTTTALPYGQQIREQLLAVIQRAQPQDRLPTEVALAKAYGVNRLTVHAVMAALSREGYIERTPGRGTFVARRDRRIMLGLDNPRRLGEIVIAYPDYYAFDIWKKVHAAEELARHHEVELVHLKMSRSTRYANIADLLRSRGDQVKGAIVLPSTTTIDRKSLALIDAFGIPVVLLSAMDRPSLGRNIRLVCYDAFKAGYLAATHLLDCGHERVAYVQNEPWNPHSRLHYNGVKAALYEHGSNLRDLLRSPLIGVQHWDDSCESGYRFTADLLKSRPTAIIVRSIPGAIGALRAISEAGLQCPQDVSVVTQGETGPQDAYQVPAITSVVSDYNAWLGAAIDIILGKRGRGEGQITIDVRLVERESVKTIRDSGEPQASYSNQIGGTL